MERLTKYICDHAHGAEGVRDDALTGSYCRGEFEATAIVDRLAAIEDILGDEYDLERLRVIMDAEQRGGLIVGYGPGDPGEPGEPGELGVMEEVAADNVVVVRCRECAHYKICDEWENGKRMLFEIHHHSYLDHDGDNHFCSWGQRKIETVLAKSEAKDESLEDEHEASK